jgi:hypothetical protein
LGVEKGDGLALLGWPPLAGHLALVGERERETEREREREREEEGQAGRRSAGREESQSTNLLD